MRSISHRTVIKEDVKPRALSNIMDQLPGIVVVPPFLVDKLTDSEIKLLLHWNGISEEEPIYFEELSTWGLFHTPPTPGVGISSMKPPIVYSRKELRR